MAGPQFGHTFAGSLCFACLCMQAGGGESGCCKWCLDKTVSRVYNARAIT